MSSKYTDKGGTFTWDIALYRTADETRTLRIRQNGVYLNLTDFDDIIQEVRRENNNELVLSFKIGDGFVINPSDNTKLEIDYSVSRTSIPNNTYVHDIFFILDGKRIPYIKRSRFVINRNVTGVQE